MKGGSFPEASVFFSALSADFTTAVLQIFFPIYGFFSVIPIDKSVKYIIISLLSGKKISIGTR